tara:strand:+ start:839 stop:985 length:147 start_codon:yes stop_codon:yes gene_type:complete
VGNLWVTPGEGYWFINILMYLPRFAKETLRKPLRNPKKLFKNTEESII